MSVRITEGVERSQQMGGSTVLDHIPPQPFTGPSSLHFLQGACFTSSFDRWEFKLCPFSNITSHRINGHHDVLLGVWGSWNTTSSLYTQQIYINGKECASPTDPENPATTHTITTVDFVCNASTLGLMSVDDSNDCHYKAVFGIPMSRDVLSGENYLVV
ncbi:hypothetical protein EON65_21510 [archaeon]|nr:MAG: hypothetical protein EON65_21510 [archaeon]